MRLITRSDFDGLACAAILKDLGLVDEVVHAHPKDLQDGKIAVTGDDILANVPFVEGCGLWFDHHSSEHERKNLAGKFTGSSDAQPSAARVIYNYYRDNREYTERLEKFEEMLAAVDIADSGRYTKEDILHPRGWMMLAFLADPRTGLGYHQSFRVSNLELMKTLPDLLRTKTIDEILALPDFDERVTYYYENNDLYREYIQKYARLEKNVILLDFRGVRDVPAGNRFIEFVLFPLQNVSVRVQDGRNKEFVAIAVGYSTINRTATVDIGSLMLKYGGGGHKKVGTCQVPYNRADEILAEILNILNS